MNPIAFCLFFISLNAHVLLAQSEQANRSPSPVTFNQNIAPIIHEKCSSCHRPGQAGPFDLLTYEDVRKRARTIEAVLDSGYMPPWKPIHHNIEFANDRSVSDEQKAAISHWIKDGMLQGNGLEPQAPKFPDGWTLGQPDLVIKMNGKFEVPASGPDVYRSFVFAMDLAEDKWIKAVEFRPTATSAVHHALFFVDQQKNARTMDGADGKPGIAGMSFLGAANTNQTQTEADKNSEAKQSRLARLWALARNRTHSQTPEFARALSSGLGGYVPGTTPAKLPGDLAMYLPKESDIVMQTHFHPSGKKEIEQGELALYFADHPPSKQLVQIQVPAAFGIGTCMKIPAGEKEYQVEESFHVPVDIELISIGAHAHYICRQVEMVATLPNGSRKTLLDIDDWDLDWQDRYFFKAPVAIPAGTQLSTTLIYDNSADNPENPNDPPKEIRWGRESGDEMGSVTIQAVAVDESDRSKLIQSVGRYMLSSVTQNNLVDVIMQLDTNRDGGLQPTEAPPRMAQQFEFFDQNGDGKLNPEELKIITNLMPRRFSTR